MEKLVEEKESRILQYPKIYLNDYGFEKVMVAARQKLVLQLLMKEKPDTVLEVGCGIDSAFNRAFFSNFLPKKWIVVEPSITFCETITKNNVKESKNLFIINGFLEDSLSEILKQCGKKPDFIICSGVLNEVPNLEEFLKAVKDLLSIDSVAHFNVPNAFSLHRRLAKAMKLIPNEKTFSDRNKSLSQYRIFDSLSLSQEIENAGLQIVETGGYMLKPFTHQQMESIDSILSQEMLDGLWELGNQIPEIASEIYVNARIH